MSFYDDASLVVIPSAQKTSKLYAVKPTDGSGDLAFTRTGDTATRVNSAGLIEKVRTNLNPNGNLVGLALNTSPTGYTNFNTGTFEPVTNTTSEVGTFCKFTTSGTRSFLVRSFTGITSGINYSFSFKVQSVTGSLALDNSFLVTSGGTGSIYYVDGVPTASGTAITQGTVYVEFEATASIVEIRIGSGVAVAATAVLEIGNFQLESGDIATDYIPTTSAAVSVGPVANVPRLDYLGSTCPRLLLEPQRTNLVTYSEQFDNAGWSKLNATITANNIVSPDGYTNADRITDDAVNSLHAVFRGGWDTTQRTASVYAKAGTSSKVYIINGTIGTGVFADLSTGTFVATGTFTGTLTNVGNGWYRITATHTAASAQTFAVGLFTGTSTTDYVGTGSFAYIWGAQVEAGAYATSYIPTLAASATRGADTCSKTGISSLIGQTEGTLFAEFVWTKVGKTYQSILLGGTTNYNNTVYLLTIESSGAASYQLRIGGTTAIATLNTTFTTGTRYKIALAYKSGSIAFYVNGSSVGTSSATYGAVSEAISQFRYDWPYGGDEQWCSPISQTLLFKTRLTNAQLAELTTL